MQGGEGRAGHSLHEAPVSGRFAHVLVVEDNMIIALDTQDMLLELGVRRVSIAASVKRALETIADDRPELALLDYNLGNETSDAVAERLTAEGIPYWFVTGYGDAIREAAADRSLGIVQKPFSEEDLARLLQETGATG